MHSILHPNKSSVRVFLFIHDQGGVGLLAKICIGECANVAVRLSGHVLDIMYAVPGLVNQVILESCPNAGRSHTSSFASVKYPGYPIESVLSSNPSTHLVGIRCPLLATAKEHSLIPILTDTNDHDTRVIHPIQVRMSFLQAIRSSPPELNMTSINTDTKPRKMYKN